MDRIDPDEHAVEHGELCAHLIEDIIFVNHRNRFDAHIGERREHILEPARLRRDGCTGGFVTAPQDPELDAYLGQDYFSLRNCSTAALSRLIASCSFFSPGHSAAHWMASASLPSFAFCFAVLSSAA